jgi:hypothetical protein
MKERFSIKIFGMALHKFTTKINIQTQFLMQYALLLFVCYLVQCSTDSAVCEGGDWTPGAPGNDWGLEGEAGCRDPQVGGGQAGKGRQRRAEAEACCRTAVCGPRWRRSQVDGGAKDGEHRSSGWAPSRRERWSGGLYHGGRRRVGRVESLALVD